MVSRHAAPSLAARAAGGSGSDRAANERHNERRGKSTVDCCDEKSLLKSAAAASAAAAACAAAKSTTGASPGAHVRYVPNPYHSSAPSLSGCSSRCARNNSCGDGGGAAGPTPHVTLSHHGSTKNDGPVLSSCMFTASLSWQMMVGLHHRKWPRKTLSPHRNGGDRLNRAERQSACTEGTGSSTPQQSPCTKRHSF